MHIRRCSCRCPASSQTQVRAVSHAHAQYLQHHRCKRNTFLSKTINAQSVQGQPSGVDDILLHNIGVEPGQASDTQLMQATANLARAELSERWVKTQAQEHRAKARRVVYLSMEFLMGRTLTNALASLNLTDTAKERLRAHARQLEDIGQTEPDAALGNGGLGRLAACFLDSMATLQLPSWGYGIRYEYGMFSQEIVAGAQVEYPDPWLVDGSPWEFARSEVTYPVRYGGWVERINDQPYWLHNGLVDAKAYDMVVPGHGTDKVSTLRLWKAAAPAHFNLDAFNSGDYARAAAAKNEFEHISWVLYPNDSTPAGRELRLKQEYFFVSASLQDLIRRHLSEYPGLDNLAEQVAIHLNDTHPAIAVAELMRILCDEHSMPWEKAWAICGKTFSYTNHTLMPEALETWPVGLIAHVLPRHLEIIYLINHQFLEEAAQFRPGDSGFLSRLSIIDESGERRVRMAHLSVIGSHKINGVSTLHSQLLVDTIFADFAQLWPERFTNMTNGVTPRRWLQHANPQLSSLIDQTIGPGWRTDLSELRLLAQHADDSGLQRDFLRVKAANKTRLADYIHAKTGVTVNPASLFDVQIKRIHEYKRQLLNLLHVIWRYQAILTSPDANWVPRTVILAGKAASSYHTAKLVIHLVHDLAHQINNDPRIGDKLKLVFVPNYGVSVAEAIIPAADLSEQISTAGTEASGTGNMKLALNGALTIGTDDGANIEIREQVGDDNIFIFGLKTPEVRAFREKGYHPYEIYKNNAQLKAVLDALGSGYFSPEEPKRYRSLVNNLIYDGDHYMLLADFVDYVNTQAKVDALYRDPARWSKCAITNIAGMGPFSSDRTIAAYARDIWRVKPIGQGTT